MRWTLCITALCFAEVLAAGEPVNVAVCNLDGVRQSVVLKAQVEAGLVYARMGVPIEWHDCAAIPDSPVQGRTPWFVIRLRDRNRGLAFGPACCDVMGAAAVDGTGGGTVADAYFRAIQLTAAERHVDPAVLLGFVMAHELGHLLLGPGHTADGLMQSAWGQKQIDALGQRQLRFSHQCALRIRSAIAGRTAPNHPESNGNN